MLNFLNFYYFIFFEFSMNFLNFIIYFYFFQILSKNTFFWHGIRIYTCMGHGMNHKYASVLTSIVRSNDRPHGIISTSFAATVALLAGA